MITYHAQSFEPVSILVSCVAEPCQILEILSFSQFILNTTSSIYLSLSLSLALTHNNTHTHSIFVNIYKCIFVSLGVNKLATPKKQHS